MFIFPMKKYAGHIPRSHKDVSQFSNALWDLHFKSNSLDSYGVGSICKGTCKERWMKSPQLTPPTPRAKKGYALNHISRASHSHPHNDLCSCFALRMKFWPLSVAEVSEHTSPAAFSDSLGSLETTLCTHNILALGCSQLCPRPIVASLKWCCFC